MLHFSKSLQVFYIISDFWDFGTILVDLIQTLEPLQMLTWTHLDQLAIFPKYPTFIRTDPFFTLHPHSLPHLLSFFFSFLSLSCQHGPPNTSHLHQAPPSSSRGPHDLNHPSFKPSLASSPSLGKVFSLPKLRLLCFGCSFGIDELRFFPSLDLVWLFVWIWSFP